jgi:hypothetical protein
MAATESSQWKTASGSNSVVECNLAKVEVEGSNPFSRSIFHCNGSLRGTVAKW